MSTKDSNEYDNNGGDDSDDDSDGGRYMDVKRVAKDLPVVHEKIAFGDIVERPPQLTAFQTKGEKVI